MDIVSDYVFTDLQPISTGQKEGFKRMFKELNPEITKISPPPGATPCGEPFVENILKILKRKKLGQQVEFGDLWQIQR